MANRFPLIIDTADSNKLKELPSGDNLNLQGCALINATSIAVNGAITATDITIDGQNFAEVAFSGDFNDLSNTPNGFSGEYADLSGKPTIPTNTRGLSDVQDTAPSDGQVLQWSEIDAKFIPSTLDIEFDFSTVNLSNLNDVVIPSIEQNRYLKFFNGAWRASRVSYSELTDKPVNVSSFINDANYLVGGNIIEADLQGNVISEDSTVLVNSTNGSVNLDGTVKGNIIPDTNESYDIGSDTNRFKDLYLSGSTINLGGTDISVVGGELRFEGVKIPTLEDLAGGAITVNPTGDLQGSVFADDSTLLVDGVNGVIPTSVLQGDISNDIKGSDIVIETTTSPGSITLTQTGIGAISLSATAIDFNNSPIQNFILSTLSSGLTAPGSAVVAGDTEINFNFSMAPTALTVEQDAITIGSGVTVTGFVGDVTGDLKGSVFADDSTLLVDGVNGEIPGYVKIADLKTALQDGAGDYAAFKAWVLANL